MKHLFNITLLVFLGWNTSSCSYSLTGSSLSPETETAFIDVFPNNSSLFNPDLSQDFTNALMDRFDQRTQLSILNQGPGDITIEGEISDYRVSVVNVGVGNNGLEAANQNQLSISVQVRYSNQKEPEKSWTRSFTESETFPATSTLESIQDETVAIINERLVNAIFNAIVADW